MKKLISASLIVLSFNTLAQYSSPYDQNSQPPYGQNNAPPPYGYPQQSNQIRTLGEPPNISAPKNTSPFYWPPEQQPIQQPTVNCNPNGMGGFTCR